MGAVHHCKQGGCAKSEVDGTEQMAAGETPDFLILALNYETFTVDLPWHRIAGSINLGIGLERCEFPGKVGNACGHRVKTDDDSKGWGSCTFPEHGTPVVDHEGDAEDAEDDEDKVDAAEVPLKDAFALLPVMASLRVHLDSVTVSLFVMTSLLVHLLTKCRLLKVMWLPLPLLQEYLAVSKS